MSAMKFIAKPMTTQVCSPSHVKQNCNFWHSSHFLGYNI